MKHLCAVTVFTCCVLLPAFYTLAYQDVGSGANCLECHTDYSNNTDWHTEHQGFTGNDCTACHTNGFGVAVPTGTCSACHSNQPCSWVETHESDSEFTGNCIVCHSTCSTGDDGDGDSDDGTGDDSGCGDDIIYEGPCLIITSLGNHAENITLFRKFRDEILVKTPLGKAIIRSYYSNACAMNSLLARYPALKSVAAAAVDAVIPVVESCLFHRHE